MLIIWRKTSLQAIQYRQLEHSSTSISLRCRPAATTDATSDPAPVPSHGYSLWLRPPAHSADKDVDSVTDIRQLHALDKTTRATAHFCKSSNQRAPNFENETRAVRTLQQPRPERPSATRKRRIQRPLRQPIQILRPQNSAAPSLHSTVPHAFPQSPWRPVAAVMANLCASPIP